MTEAEIREAEKAQEEYRTAWIEASYIVAGWWKVILEEKDEQGKSKTYDTSISKGGNESL